MFLYQFTVLLKPSLSEVVALHPNRLAADVVFAAISFSAGLSGRPPNRGAILVPIAATSSSTTVQIGVSVPVPKSKVEPSIFGCQLAIRKASMISVIYTQSALVWPLDSLGASPRSNDVATVGISLLKFCPGP